MTWSIIITLIFAGLFFLILEMLVIPGTTVVGIVGFLLLIVGIWGAYAYQGSSSGHYTLAVSFGLTLIVLFYSLRAKTWNRFVLKDEITGKVNTVDGEVIRVGDEGFTVSRLAPMGNAKFEDELYEVSTYGDFIDQEKAVVVVKIEMNKIIVKLKTN